MLQRGPGQNEATYQALLYGLLIDYCSRNGMICKAGDPAGKGLIDIFMTDSGRTVTVIIEVKRNPMAASKELVGLASETL